MRRLRAGPPRGGLLGGGRTGRAAEGSEREGNSVKPTAKLAALALAAVATAACAAAGYKTDCYEVFAGSFDFDSKTGQWSFGGLCIERLTPACPQLREFRCQAGVDENGNGVLDPGERLIDVHDVNPQSNSVCAAATSGNVGPGKRGKRILWHYECSKGDEPHPFVSKSGEIEVD